MPESSDSDFTWNSFFDSNNNELVATFGNLVNRIQTLIKIILTILSLTLKKLMM